MHELLANSMFETRHRNAPSNIQDLFQDISDIHSHKTQFSVSNDSFTHRVPHSRQFLESE